MTPIEVIYKVNPNNQARIREDLENLKHNLKRDMSNYAKGRPHFWIDYKWDLRHKKIREDAIQMPRLKQFMANLNIHYDLGFAAALGGGITWHRDDIYCDWVAYTLNLSTKPFNWGYQPNYSQLYYRSFAKQNYNAQKQIITLEPGEIIRYNCKNPHATLSAQSDRWGLTFWSLKPQFKNPDGSVIVHKPTPNTNWGEDVIF